MADQRCTATRRIEHDGWTVEAGVGGTVHGPMLSGRYLVLWDAIATGDPVLASKLNEPVWTPARAIELVAP